MGALAPDKLPGAATRKEKFKLVSDHNRSLLRRQPGALTMGHSPKSSCKAQHSEVRGMLHDRVISGCSLYLSVLLSGSLLDPVSDEKCFEGCPQEQAVAR